MLEKVLTIQQVKGARVTAAYDARFDTPKNPRWKAGLFIEALYKGLSANH